MYRLTAMGIEQTPRPLYQISEDNSPSLSHSTLMPWTDGNSPLAHRWDGKYIQCNQRDTAY
jgi:hypothetical protein